MAPSPSSSTAPAALQQLGWQARLRWVHGICQGLPKVAQQLDEFLANQTGVVSTAREMQEWREAWVGFQQHKDAWVQACSQALQQAARKPPSQAGESSAGLVGKKYIQLLGDLGQALTNAMDPTQTRLPAQLLRGRRRGGGRLRESHSVSVMAAEAVMHPPQWSKRQTTAPALGSLGSCDPGLAGALTRSSRLTPSHMAMAAATNTEE